MFRHQFLSVVKKVQNTQLFIDIIVQYSKLLLNLTTGPNTMTIQMRVINEEQAGGKTAIVQVDGDVAETLSPGQQVTIFIDADSEAIISEETNGY